MTLNIDTNRFALNMVFTLVVMFVYHSQDIMVDYSKWKDIEVSNKIYYYDDLHCEHM